MNPCHAEGVPRVASAEALAQAAAGFEVADLDLVTESAALAAAQRSLDDSGLLLLGEIHGVRENPLLIRALLLAFGLTSLALEWPDDLAPPVEGFLATGTLADHWLLWSGDGRITAGHLASRPAGPGTLVVAGNAHTPTSSTSLGVPMGACLARERPGVREIRINYGGGSYYNLRSRQFDRNGPQPGQTRLHQDDGALVLDLPAATEAVVPQRPWPKRPG